MGLPLAVVALAPLLAGVAALLAAAGFLPALALGLLATGLLLKPPKSAGVATAFLYLFLSGQKCSL